MNNDFYKRIKPEKNFAVAFIIDFIVYIVIFGIEYFMGKELDIWFNNHPGFIETILKWIIDNPIVSTIIIFAICFFGLMIYDYKKSSEKEETTATSAPVNQSHFGDGDNVAGNKIVYNDSSSEVKKKMN